MENQSTQGKQVDILDPSDKFRPEIDEEQFRVYTNDNAFYDRVQKVYQTLHTEQSYKYATEKKKEWLKLNKVEMTILEALHSLDALVDETDPDCDVPNSVHMFQTAERIREVHPDKPWFQLTGLVHDLGKIMGVYGEPQWAITGDTFPVGCAYSDKIVFGKESFKDNPDYKHPVYSTKLGIYKEKIGLDNVHMSWGHDEYLYRVLKNNTCSLPEEALYMIRFHSFYPWHTGRDYDYLCSERDLEMMPWVLEFNKFDLYSKSDSAPDIEAIEPYYQKLIDEYIPGKLKW